MKTQLSKLVLAAMLFSSCSSNNEPPTVLSGSDLLTEVGGSSSSVMGGSSSSGDGGSSSSGVFSSSSNNSNGSSSSYYGGDGTSSSSSEGGSLIGGHCSVSGFYGDEFIDSRDCKRYKYEMASNGRVWMMENLNYSRNNTLGWCYKTGTSATRLGNAGEDLEGCSSPYGRYYTYDIAIDGTTGQGLCPDGWNIPSIAEWGAVSGVPNGFYVKAGNYELDQGDPLLGGKWKDRGDCGFYWVRNTPSGNSVGFALVGGSSIETRPATSTDAKKPAAKTSDYFSVRCIMDIDYEPKCSGQSFDPATQRCVGDKISYRPLNTPCGGKIVYIELPDGWGNSTYITWQGQFILITGTKEGEWTRFTLPTNLSDDGAGKQEIIFSDYNQMYNNADMTHFITKEEIGENKNSPNTGKFLCSDFGVVTYIMEDPANPGKTLLNYP